MPPFDSSSSFIHKEPLIVPEIAAYATNEDKQEALDAMLKQLASNEALDEADTKASVTFFQKLYAEEEGTETFRHSYARILEIMIGDYDPSHRMPDYELSAAATTLSNNIGLLNNVIKTTGDEQLNRKFRKLRDHVALETQRLNYIVRQNRLQYETSDGAAKKVASDLDKFYSELANSTDRLGKRIEKREQQIDRLQREYIALLGILAAVVIATNGSIVFSSSSIQALAGQNVFYLAFIVTTVGAFIFNVLFALFTFIYRMVRQDGSYWGVVNKDMFIRINKWIACALVILFIVSGICYCFEQHILSFTPQSA